MAEQQLPVWNSEGIEPPANLQIDGWQPGVKPPAQYFDWLFNRAYKCLEELQAITEALETNKANGTELTTLNNKVTQHLDDFNAMRTRMQKRLTATQSSSQSIASAIDTIIIFNNTIENDLNYFTLHSNGTVTVNKNCTLVVRATIAVYPNALNGYIRLNLLKNNQYLISSAQIDSLSNYSKSLLTTFEIDCVAGDNLAVQVYQQNSTSTPISTDTSNWFTKLQLGVKL